MTLDARAVLDAAAAWVWVPDEARETATGEFRLVAYPEHFADPTVAFALDSERTAAALVDDVLAAARELGRAAVTFAGLGDRTRPADLERHLRERGAVLREELAVLALDLAAPRAALDPPADVGVRVVDDLDTLRDEDRVATAVFGGRPRDDDELAAALPAVLAEGPDAVRLVAYREGEAVGVAGATAGQRELGGVLRLWGGGVLPLARGRGVYRALLEHRLREGERCGLRLALVKGRVATSAPLLRRAGFTAYGEERSWHLTALRSPRR